MSRFNLEDYSPVEERIALFYGDHSEGRILTSVERLEPPLVVFRAEVYRDASDERPWATGYAYEKEGDGNVNRTSYIENCETSAIGRALANAGYHGKRAGSPRPSREEMAKVERMGGGSPRGNGSVPATEKQVGLITTLSAASVLTESERDGVRGRLARGMTIGQASEAIDWLNATIEQRKSEATA